MKHLQLKKMRVGGLAFTNMGGSLARWSVLAIALFMGAALLAAAVRAYNYSKLNGVRVTKRWTGLPGPDPSAPPRATLRTRLALQPEANKLRHRLGQRFVSAGKERSILIGALTIGGTERKQIQIIRTQNEDDEQIEIALDGAASVLTWNGKNGAVSAGKPAFGVERALIERLVLDSPDQFVLAQRRGASYYTVAQQAMPEELASDDYNGPVWDIVRVGERSGSSDAKPESLYRLYYINSATGLIEKIFSNELGQSVAAELSGWTQVVGEWVPARTIWRINKQPAMELNLINITYGPRQ